MNHLEAFLWRPSQPPDFAEYSVLRSLDEAGMKRHLKTLLAQVRAEIVELFPYSYRLALFGLATGVCLLVLSAVLEPAEGPKPLHCELLYYAGGFLAFWGLFRGISVGMAVNSIRENLIVAREYYVRCWVAAQNLDFDRFQRHISDLIRRPPSRYEVL